VPPTELRRLVRDLGRVPAQRDTTYGIVKLYAVEPDGESDPLADIQDPDARFGSYRRLIASGEFRFAHPSAAGVSSPSSPAETPYVTCTAAPATAPPVLGGATNNS
jgi:hypothetical protein